MLSKSIKSTIDQSKNFIFKYGDSDVEARYVRRNSEKISAYVSGHNGCTMGCKFCWLTQQGQTSFKHSDLDIYNKQLKTVLNYYDYQVKHGLEPSADRVNVNFMARGEPLANKVIMNNFNKLYESYHHMASQRDLDIRMNVSTIMPFTVINRDLYDIFGNDAFLYYSLYSVKSKFRNDWIPNGIDYNIALDKLKKYQEKTGNIITFHWAFIKDQNDNVNDVIELTKILKGYDFNAKFNLVRYNPYDDQSTESEYVDELFQIVADGLDNDKSYIVPRVGSDVYASCGMFVK